ncbi:MAG: hypothetical protein IJ774_08485 [Selenomonadaceae bacterium]|nr:hypothetical protein [Selenomonadaceae bacterium]
MAKRNTNIEARVSSLEATFKTFMDEMRDRDNQRATDMRELRQKHDEDMKEMRADIKSSLKHIQNLTIAAMVGIGAITAATWAFMWSTSQNTYQQVVQPPPAQTQAAPYQQTDQTAR